MSVGNNVGFRVGFTDLPDKIRFSRINGLSGACRKCRVSQVEGSIQRSKRRRCRRAELGQPTHSFGLE